VLREQGPGTPLHFRDYVKKSPDPLDGEEEAANVWSRHDCIIVSACIQYFLDRERFFQAPGHVYKDKFLVVIEVGLASHGSAMIVLITAESEMFLACDKEWIRE
jgi:hypothetical protein